MLNNINVFDGYSYDLDDYDIVGDDNCQVAVPNYYNFDIRKKILAAIKSYELNNKSIDHVLKYYIEDYYKPVELTTERKLVREIIMLAQNYINSIDTKIELYTNSINSIGLIVARSAYIRLKNSFRSAVILNRHCFFFETMNICRLIFEQISWCNSIYELDENRIIKTKPSATISKFKKQFPNAGDYYGMLSSHAHISSDLAISYMNIKDDITAVTLQSIKNTLICSMVILRLAEVYGIVFEKIFKDYLVGFDYINIINNKIKINERRESKKVISKYSKKVENLLNKVEKSSS